MPHEPHVPHVTFDTDVEVLDSSSDALDKGGKLSSGTLPTLPSTERLGEADADTDVLGELVPPTMTNSQRSQASSVASSHSSSAAKSPGLRGNLTRQHTNRDPNSVFEVVNQLGKGSMGSVSLVRKRSVGGSARYNPVARAKVKEKYDNCFKIPLIGGILEFFLKQKAVDEMERASLEPMNDNDTSSSTTVYMPEFIGDANIPAYAMKSIHYNLIQDKVFVDELRNEIAVLKTLDHPHVVRILETFDYNQQIFVVMEVCAGGDLYTRDPYTEDEAARIVTAVLRAVAYMHERGVIHRDIKYENIMYVSDSPQANIKLIDFGLSKEIKEHEHLQEGAGTIYTMAPEVLKGDYSKEADLWSIGVVAFMLLSSQMPFFGKKRRLVIDQILKGKYEFKGRRWQTISNQAKMFVEDLLVLDPAHRASAEGALGASWLNRRHTASTRAPRKAELTHVKQCIQRYVTYPRLRQLALMVIAHRSTSDEIGILRKIFQHYDRDHSGYLNYDEFKEALEEIGFTESDYRDVFDAVDVDGTGAVRYTEFLAASIEATGWIGDERLAEAFDRVDHDDTGYISKENLRYLLGDDFPEDEIDIIMKEAGSDNGKGISYAAFMSQWQDDKDTFVSEWRKHMVPDTVVQDNTGAYGSDERGDLVSEISFDLTSFGDDGVSNFREEKAMSERKKKNMQIAWSVAAA